MLLIYHELFFHDTKFFGDTLRLYSIDYARISFAKILLHLPNVGVISIRPLLIPDEHSLLLVYTRPQFLLSRTQIAKMINTN